MRASRPRFNRKAKSAPAAASDRRPVAAKEKRGQKPAWDNDEGILWFGDIMVKEFKQPSLSQRLILMSFQELNWPLRIDDPLPGEPAKAKKRLNMTIYHLNRAMKNPVIHFHGDGTGQGIRWKAIEPG